MRTLSEEGLKHAESVAQRHNVSLEAVVSLLQALERGNGMQAQFSHPDLGGLGQWSRGGMIMIGDMFNNGLKARIDQLCNELSELLHANAMFKPAPRSSATSQGFSWQSSSFASGWWPEECGTPGSSGSQNDMRYACFPDTRRLAIQRDGVVSVYDTGDHRITGVSQQQSGSQDLQFTSQYGTVRLHELSQVHEPSPTTRQAAATRPQEAPVVLEDDMATARAHQAAAPAPPPMAPPVAVHAETPRARPASPDEDVFAKIERLHDLQQRGILSEAEFADKKQELLARI